MTPTYSKTDPDCGSPDQVVFVGNIRLESIDPDPNQADPASAVLTIDVIASPGNELRSFQFVTLILQIVEPTDARFVDHSGRNNFHWDVLADPATTNHAFDPPDADTMYWAEDVDTVAPTSTLRIREDMTNLLSSPDNGRTYFVGVAGIKGLNVLEFKALASACDVRMTSCELTIANLHAGEALLGYIG
jgi:hypothetical protein